MGEPQPPGEPGPEDDPLVECIRDGIYTAVGLGLLAINRVQAARRDVVGQMPDDLREAFAELADQVPEDVRNAAAELTRQLPDSVRTVLSDAVEQAPAIADALREFVSRNEP
ncbi:MAG: hypothetical protein KTV68_13090 [Acidimicrobiia bacterium]|nr:hypothetical protein [Acidimicrobiia bacterium]MCY4432493.1 hypothetical protein [bacterium]